MWSTVCLATLTPGRASETMHILLVSSGMPLPGQAGSPRAYNLARALANRHTLTLLLVTSGAGAWGDPAAYRSGDSPFSRVERVIVESEAGSTMGKLINAAAGNPWFVTRHERRDEHRSAVSAVKELCPDVDAVWIDGLPLLQYAERCGQPFVVDEVDYMSRLMYTQASMGATRARRLVDRWRASLTRRYERSHLRQASAVTLISSLEAELMASDIGVRPHLIMNGCDTSFFSPVSEPPHVAGRPALVFVGNFPYGPNRDAAEFIVRDLGPALASRFPEVKIHLVGPPPPEGFGNPSAFVEIAGFAPDVRTYYAGADVFLCPLRFGGGVKNKMLEAGAMGCPIVASEISAEGIAFDDGVHFLKAATPTEYVEAVARLTADGGALGRALGRQARELVEREYGWESEARRLESLLAFSARSVS